MRSKDIGSRIIDLREKRGLSQKDFADIISVSAPTLSRWENGVVTPPLPQLEHISEVLGTSLEEIFSGDKVEYEKLRKRFILVKSLLISLAIIMLTSIMIMIIPRYKVINAQEDYNEEYGKCLIIYVKPVLHISDAESYTYGKKIALKFSDKSDYEMIEVIFVKSTTHYDDKDNEYYSNFYFPNSTSANWVTE